MSSCLSAQEIIVKEEVLAEPAIVKQEVIVPETTTTYKAPPPPPQLEHANGVKEGEILELIPVRFLVIRLLLYLVFSFPI